MFPNTQNPQVLAKHAADAAKRTALIKLITDAESLDSSANTEVLARTVQVLAAELTATLRELDGVRRWGQANYFQREAAVHEARNRKAENERLTAAS